MYEWKVKAVNKIYLDENTGGKGKYFKTRFLQPGLVKYSFGVCVLEKDTIDKFIQGFVGCPVIIGHNDVTNENAKELSCGNICHVWYDEADGWYWGDGIIDNDEALELINNGYNVSCQYEITEYSNNTTNALHNGNPYDKVILNGKPEHLAIVETPRYENAMIAVNAIDLTEEPEPENIKEIIVTAINSIKETTMFKNLFNKKETQMDKEEMKSLFMDCIQECLKASNEEEEKKEEDKKEDDKEEEKKAENEEKENELEKEAENKCKNEVVDKRDIIRQIMAIAGKEEASEEVKTIAKLAEKLAYDKSEADDKADNKAAKNEEEDEKEEKEEAKNKAKNSINEQKGLINSMGTQKSECKYITKSRAIELGNELFG